MVAFPWPRLDFDYDSATEIAALRRHRNTARGRAIHSKANRNRLLLATWNIANLDAHERREQDYETLAEMLSWFDFIAIQEVNDDLVGLRGLMSKLPRSYQVLFSDKAGNNERLAYIFRTPKVRLLSKVGEIALTARERASSGCQGSNSASAGSTAIPI